MSITMLTVVLLSVSGPVGCAAAPGAVPMGEEAFGNAAVSNQAQWADGVVATANDPSRVYRRWVNGDEEFCFQGDAGAVNRVISRFAKVADPQKAIVLLPTTGLTRSFENIKVAFRLRFHVPSGICLAVAKMEKDKPVSSRHPRLFIHVGSGVEPGGLAIPKGLKVLTGADLVRKYRRGLTSSEKQTRGRACSLLARYPWVEGVVPALIEVVGGDDDWSILNALAGLGAIGAAAKPAVKPIEDLASRTQDDRTRQACEAALRKIAAADGKTGAAASPKHRDEIRRFIKERAGN